MTNTDEISPEKSENLSTHNPNMTNSESFDEPEPQKRKQELGTRLINCFLNRTARAPDAPPTGGPTEDRGCKLPVGTDRGLCRPGNMVTARVHYVKTIHRILADGSVVPTIATMHRHNKSQIVIPNRVEETTPEGRNRDNRGINQWGNGDAMSPSDCTTNH